MQNQSWHGFYGRICLLCALVYSLGLNAQANNPQWQLYKDKQQVQIYTRALPGKALQIKAQTQLPLPPSALPALLDDVTQGPLWIHNCQSVRLLDAKGNIRLVYTRFNAPWPFSDRDMLTRSQSITLANGLQINVASVVDDALMPEQTKLVRMRKVTGQWQAIQQEVNGELITTFSYQGSGDPGGSLPTWLANKILIDSTFRTFVAMREQLEHYAFDHD